MAAGSDVIDTTGPPSDIDDDDVAVLEDDEGPDQRRWFQPPSAVQAIALLVALLFFGGVVGWLLGSSESDPEPTDADVGFLQDMITHHEQAIELAEEAVGKGTSPVTRSFAEEVMFFQAREIGIMQTYLDEWGYDLSVRPETAMDWMGMSVPVDQMVGLASDEEFAALHAAEGEAVDQQFIELMIQHHLGGVHMAEAAAERASDPRIVELAEVMAVNQHLEVEEYQGLQERLGFPVTG